MKGIIYNYDALYKARLEYEPMSLPKFCELTGVNHRTARDIFNKMGGDPKPFRPKRKYKHDPEIKHLIQKNPDISAREIRRTLRIDQKTLVGALERLGLQLKTQRTPPPEPPPPPRPALKVDTLKLDPACMRSIARVRAFKRIIPIFNERAYLNGIGSRGN